MGIVQGLTEFIPVSSTAHLRILPEICGKEDFGAAFTAVIQIGTLLALLIYFRMEIYHLMRDLCVSLKRRDYSNPNFLLSIYIILGTLPIVVFGLLLKELVETELRSMFIVATALIFFAILLLFSEILGKKTKELKDLNIFDAVIVGLFQAFALIPGASRSGVTICAAMFLGYKRDVSARFSFLLSIPSVLGAGLFEMRDVIRSDANFDTTMVIIASATSFLSGLLAIEFLLRFLANHRINVFSYYRIALGILILLFFLE